MSTLVTDHDGIIVWESPDTLEFVDSCVGRRFSTTPSLPEWLREQVWALFLEAMSSGRPSYLENPLGRCTIIPGPQGAVVVLEPTPPAADLLRSRRKTSP
jgi:hypothetical protein